MPLPAPNLDDRRFQDFVDDAKRLLQRRIPTWTDHNVSDPGVTLIEAVATIADQLSYRLNQVPERHHRKFLDLLGITLRPPTAARTDLTFRLSAARPETITVPSGTAGSTRRSPGEPPVSFTTLDDLEIVSVSLSELRAAPALGEEASVLRDLGPDLANAVPSACFSDVPQPGDRLYVGLSEAAPAGMILLRTDSIIEGIGVDPDRPPLRWEAAVPGGWGECDVESDSTGGLNRPGDILLHLPREHTTLLLNGIRAGWIRAVVTDPADDVPAYSRTPMLTRITASCIGGTTQAVNASHIETEVLGAAEGAPGQRFTVKHRPMLAQSEPVVEVSEGEHWQEWEQIPDFAGSDRDDPHYVLDRTAGIVEFGPAVRLADGKVRSFGMVPPEGAMVRVRSYWAGGGAAGNVRANTVTVLSGSLPYVSSVTNRRPGTGGRDGESIEEAKVRAPRVLRTRDRAVSAEDFELIASEAAGAVARIRCVPPGDATEPVRVLVVPDVGGYGAGRVPFPALTPPDDVLSHIAAALDARRLIGVQVAVEPPHYQGITVAARIRPRRGVDAETLREAALAALYLWLHPWLGGSDGAGWPFGRPVTLGDVHAALSDVEGLDYVEDARLYPANPTTGTRQDAAQRVDIGPDMLPFSYDHQIQVVTRS
ncbi:MAG TPA: putative baseplate assembly protein [Jatrophihabitantaceae bacterium]|jgi:predicted phage baseplate assembly protein